MKHLLAIVSVAVAGVSLLAGEVLGVVGPAAPAKQTAAAKAESQSTAALTKAGLPKVDPQVFGELNVEKLPKGGDGQPIAATVDGQPIPAAHLLAEVKRAMGPRNPVSAGGRGVQRALADPALEGLIYQVLYEKFAQQNGLAVTSQEVEAEFRQENERRPPGNKLQDEAYATGITPDDVKRRIRNQKLAERVEQFVADQYTTGTPNPDEVKAFLLKNNLLTTSTPTIRARHLVLRAAPDMKQHAIDDASARATSILESLRAGRDFGEVARQASQDRRTTRNGGDLGYFPQGRMFKEFDAAAFRLKPGEISEVVRSPVGLHIIQVTDRQEHNAYALYWDSLRTRHVQEWRRQLLKRAKVEKFL